MITFLEGELIRKSSNEAVINCNGIGYLVQISLNTCELLPLSGNRVMIHTLLIPREDALNLYGFFNIDERNLFVLLTSISGIGAKSALGILSAVTSEDLASYVINNNINSLIKIPGIGKKSAERLILELKDKIIKFLPDSVSEKDSNINSAVKSEAVLALITLGYNRQTAEKSVKSAFLELGKDASIEQIIKVSLKNAIK
jgi:Holliday junction DNA helicase RuvA